MKAVVDPANAAPPVQQVDAETTNAKEPAK
jgi:hypothetical protein